MSRTGTQPQGELVTLSAKDIGVRRKRNPGSTLIHWSSTIRKSWLKDNEAAATTHKDALAATKHFLGLQTAHLHEISHCLETLKEAVAEKSADMVRLEAGTRRLRSWQKSSSNKQLSKFTGLC